MEHIDLTHRIIGCAMEVHKHLGNACPARQGFPSAAKLLRRVASALVEGLPMARQEVVYQRALAIEMQLQNIGLLINFDNKSLQFKRVHNNK